MHIWGYTNLIQVTVMASVSGPVVVKGRVLNAVKILEGQGSEGHVIRVLLPSGSDLTSDSIQATIWKTQLKQLGFARCVHDRCSISFLSVKGMEAHVKTCKGFSNPGDFVVCPGCGERFKMFSTMAKHHVKAHGCSAKSAPRLSTEISCSSNEDADETKAKVPSRMLMPITQHYLSSQDDDEDDELNVFESKEALRDRIMAESRMISTARPRGRPRKSVDRPQQITGKDFSASGLQYKDPFDMDESEEDSTVQCVQLQPMTDAFKKALSSDVVAQRRLSAADKQQPSSNDLIQMRTVDGKLVWVKKAEPVGRPFRVPAHPFEENLAAKEAKLADYQELVVKYEKLAEQATKMALEERTNQLINYEKELKRRELEAKKKLVGAVQVLQKIKSETHSFDDAESEVIPEVVEEVVSTEVCDQQSQFVILSDKPGIQNEERLDLEIVLPELADSIVVQHEEVVEAEQVSEVSKNDFHINSNDSSKHIAQEADASAVLRSEEHLEEVVDERFKNSSEIVIEDSQQFDEERSSSEEVPINIDSSVITETSSVSPIDMNFSKFLEILLRKTEQFLFSKTMAY